jgi:hypothetical protein
MSSTGAVISHIFVHGPENEEKMDQGKELFRRTEEFGLVIKVPVEDDSISGISSASSSSSSSASDLSESASTKTITRLMKGPLVISSDLCCQGKGWITNSGFHEDDLLFLLDSHHFLDRLYRALNRENRTFLGTACSDLSKCIAQTIPGRVPAPDDIIEAIDRVKAKYSALIPPVWTADTTKTYEVNKKHIHNCMSLPKV